MIRRRPRRRSAARGFALVEALVALAVGAMTLALLTGASWGLRTANDRMMAPEDSAAQMLTTRRVLQAWTAGIVPSGGRDPASRFVGNSEELRIALRDASGRPFVAALQVERTDTGSRVVALRAYDATDAREAGDDVSRTVLHSDPRTLRIAYLTGGSDGFGRLWNYETSEDGTLPRAIALEAAGDRILVAPLFVTRASDCVIALGLPGLEDDQCAVR